MAISAKVYWKWNSFISFYLQNLFYCLFLKEKKRKDSISVSVRFRKNWIKLGQ